jgi:hypothetical protein
LNADLVGVDVRLALTSPKVVQVPVCHTSLVAYSNANDVGPEVFLAADNSGMPVIVSLPLVGAILNII